MGLREIFLPDSMFFVDIRFGLFIIALYYFEINLHESAKL